MEKRRRERWRREGEREGEEKEREMEKKGKRKERKSKLKKKEREGGKKTKSNFFLPQLVHLLCVRGQDGVGGGGGGQLRVPLRVWHTDAADGAVEGRVERLNSSAMHASLSPVRP